MIVILDYSKDNSVINSDNRPDEDLIHVFYFSGEEKKPKNSVRMEIVYVNDFKPGKELVLYEEKY